MRRDWRGGWTSVLEMIHGSLWICFSEGNKKDVGELLFVMVVM